VAYIRRWRGLTDEYRGLGLSGGAYICRLTDEYRWIRNHVFPFLSSPRVATLFAFEIEAASSPSTPRFKKFKKIERDEKMNA
jgi:hypothetical protein